MAERPAADSALSETTHSSSPERDGAAGPLETIGAAGRQGLEAMLFLADEPVEVVVLADALELPEELASAAVEALAEAYAVEGRGMEIRRAAGGWRMYSAPAAREVLERWALAGRTGRLTQATLETLAVIAYKQPIDRQHVGDIRGVSADAAVRSLVARGLVTEVGRDPGPGHAVLYGTTPLFLERAGLDSLDELPPLTDFLPEAPAPDEPELGALKEIRRRLAEAGRDPRTPDDGDLLPPPRPPPEASDAPEIEALTDRLEHAARNAMDRLRAATGSDAPARDVPGHEGEQAAGDGREADRVEANSDPEPDDDDG